MIGLIGAMDEEIAHIKESMTQIQEVPLGGFVFLTGVIQEKVVVLLQCGIGKVSAAVGTSLMIQNFQPMYILNTGSAGALDNHLSIGDVVLGRELVQHDVDVTAFGYEIGQLPKMPRLFLSDFELLSRAANHLSDLSYGFQIVSGLIASGDRFVNSTKDLQHIGNQFAGCKLVEMESAAIAQTCHMLNTRVLIIRSVSDKANEEGAGDFKTHITIASKNAAQVVLELVQFL
jgi:adenosylhomocysteine nucleosidase